MLESVFSEFDEQPLQRVDALVGERLAGLSARCSMTPSRWSFSACPLPEDWRSISPIVRGSSGVSSR